MSPSHRVAMLVAALAVLGAGCAQVAKEVGSLTGSRDATSSTQAAPSTRPATGGAAGTSPGVNAAGGVPGLLAPPLKASRQAELELLPDRTCSRPLEKFDISAKAAEYAGTEAQLRLKRFTDSDFKYTDLTPDDRKFLNYLALTTVWIPVEVENYSARAYNMMAGNKVTLNPMDRLPKEEAEARLALFRKQLTEFPGEVRFEVNGDVSDGVYAELGALVSTSQNFLGLMASNEQARDLLLSHELSHVYKRHRLKQLQARLVAAPGGFELAKKLLSNAMGQTSSNPMSSIAFIAVNGQALLDFIQKADLNFSKNQELEADACAAIWLQRAGVDGCEAWRGFVKIAPKDGVYATTHPTTEERQANYFRKLSSVSCMTTVAVPKSVVAPIKKAVPVRKPPAKPTL